MKGKHRCHDTKTENGESTTAQIVLPILGEVHNMSKIKGEVCFGSVLVSQLECVRQLVDQGYGATSLWGEPDAADAALVLLDEEALFLIQSHVLEVVDARTGNSVTLEELWSSFCAKMPRFAVKYAVYCHFKAKAFTLRSGINFGMDYCLYRDHPSRCHAEFCVQVVDARIAQAAGAGPTELFYRTAAESSTATSSNMSWRHASSLTRVMPDVMKICLICFVLPAGWQSAPAALAAPGTSPYAHLFASAGTQDDSLAAMQSWEVRAVSMLVRRLQVNNERYPTIGDIARRYQHGSKLRHARRSKAVSLLPGQPIGVVVTGKRKKAPKKRRDQAEVRCKGQSRTNTIWTMLLNDNGPAQMEVEGIVEAGRIDEEGQEEEEEEC